MAGQNHNGALPHTFMILSVLVAAVFSRPIPSAFEVRISFGFRVSVFGFVSLIPPKIWRNPFFLLLPIRLASAIEFQPLIGGVRHFRL
jgi:hypothetical protein